MQKSLTIYLSIHAGSLAKDYSFRMFSSLVYVLTTWNQHTVR